MTFEVKWVDVTANLAAGQQPVIDESVLTGLIRREPAHASAKAWAGATQIGTVGEFWVPTSPLLGDEPGNFSVTKIGDLVRVPMFAYKTSFLSLPDLFGLGVQIGMAALADLRNHTQDVPKIVYLVIGSQCTDLRPAQESFRVYIGIALRTK